MHTPLLPWWFVIPVAALAVIVLTIHLLVLNAAAIDPKRRRIRMANNLLMILVTPLIAYGFAVVPVSNARVFMLIWTLVPGLLLIVVMLALADALHTLRLHRRARRELRARFREGLVGRSGGGGSR